MSERQYTPLFWVLEDEYPDIWDDVAALGTFVHLLKIADQSWNGERCLARFPADVDWAIVARLKAAGLVISENDRRYTVKGLDKRRRLSSKKASNAARTRWSSASSNASSNASAVVRTDAPAMPLRAEQSKAEHSKADALGAYYELKGGQVSEGAISMIAEMADEWGDDAVIRELGAEAKATPVDRTFLSRVKSRLAIAAERNAKADELARKRQAAEERKAERERIENATPEERDRAERIKQGIGAYLKGTA